MHNLRFIRFECGIWNLKSDLFLVQKNCRSSSWLHKGENYFKKKIRDFTFFFLNNAIVTRLMDRLTQQLAAAIDVASNVCTCRQRRRRGIVSPPSSPIPGDKRVRATAQTDGGSRGIHILKAAGTRLQQGVPLTLFIHLRSSDAGAAVAGAGAHGACHQVPI